MIKIKPIVVLITLTTIAYTQEINMKTVTIQDNINTLTIEDIDPNEIRSADFAQALSNKTPSVSIVRRSFISNDIILRGQKRDNINIIIDDAKIYGACPNRMDPPTSHVTSYMIDDIKIQEGAFDVENFGTLSGVVNIKTKEPKKGFNGRLDLGFGSFDYKKASLLVSGGDEKLKALLNISKESSSQYKDANKNNFSEQIPNMMTNYQPKYKNLDAFEKLSLNMKLFANISKNQNFKLNYIANRSDDILYPSSKMDAIWDKSDLVSLNYQIDNLSKYSNNLNFQTYYSQVDHPMSIKYRNSALSKGNITNHLKSKMQGLKIKNTLLIFNSHLSIGVDSSKREWDGAYYKDIDSEILKYSSNTAKKSIDNIKTINKALFVKSKTKIDNITLDGGVRYDDTDIKKSYNSFSGNIFATIKQNDYLNYFIGIGKSNRVPDARELYFVSMMAQNPNMLTGSPNLKQTKNYEIDFGFEKLGGNFSIKTKLFYSKLIDYIYINADKMKNVFENIDAKIYGLEINGVYMPYENLFLEYALSYKRGKKDKPLQNQTDIDLAEITPLKANLSLKYEHDNTLESKIDIIGVDDWRDYDSDNGEQPIKGYMIVNANIQKKFNKAFSITLGVDNLFNKVYQSTNTYKDLTLITTGTKVNDVMLLNDPGRYIYLNAVYQF